MLVKTGRDLLPGSGPVPGQKRVPAGAAHPQQLTQAQLQEQCMRCSCRRASRGSRPASRQAGRCLVAPSSARRAHSKAAPV